jgi:hypothetical protein
MLQGENFDAKIETQNDFLQIINTLFNEIEFLKKKIKELETIVYQGS